MIDRRAFLSLLAGAAVVPRGAAAQSQKLALYASVGKDLTHYDVDVAAARLVKRGSVALPGGVQYAWPHASRRFLYVASSNGGPAAAGGTHHVSAFRIDPASGALGPHGEPVALRSRPIHLATDIPSDHVLIAYNNPSALTVHRIGSDGMLGGEVEQAAPVDAGIYAHQVRVTLNNRLAVLAARGNDAAGGRPEDPGALKIFGLKSGLLTSPSTVAPAGGYGFGPRHLDFHPSRPWMYVSLERQNQIWLFAIDGDRVRPEPLFKRDTLKTRNPPTRQFAGTIHVHPNGRFLYGVNRADATIDVGGKRVFTQGENTIVVCAIDERSGEPTPVQHADTRGIHARTFHIDPSGRLLVAANLRPLLVKDGVTLRNVSAGLSVFRIGDDGMLAFVRKYDVDVGADTLFWMGMVGLPQATPA
jgi:6-phosphogluconolactonase (cycloisomerase 2 family)